MVRNHCLLKTGIPEIELECRFPVLCSSRYNHLHCLADCLASRRFELIPLSELGRPRVDVLCNMSGIFRDSFANVVDLLDDLFQRAGSADEPPEMNFVRKHALQMTAKVGHILSYLNTSCRHLMGWAIVGCS